MSSQKLVRCQVAKSSDPASVRFVPLEILGLWEHLMTCHHGFDVRERSASVWVALEETSAASQVRTAVERVTEISLFYYDHRHGMLNQVLRYVPTPETDSVRAILMRHYAGPEDATTPSPWMRERPGIWFRPLEETSPADRESSGSTQITS
jgi:hypothetical protein